MPMVWNEAADAKLFAAVLATSEGVKLQYDKLAKWMGSDCTPKAIQHRISAVRKMTSDTVTSEAKITQSGKKRKAAVKEDGDGEGTGSGEADDTPSKPKKARAPRKKATPKKSKVTVAGGDDGEEEDMKKEEDVMEEEAAAEEIIQEPVMVEDVGIVGGGEA